MRKGLFLLLFCVLIAAGCSGGSSVPVVPTDNSTAGSMDSLPMIDGTFLADSGFEATGLLGAYELSIDPDNMTAELVSKRFGTIGEGYIVSGLGFFTMLPCSSCLKLAGFTVNLDGTAELKFTAAHPFAPGNPAEPPTAANRSDLTVFDLAAVVAPGGDPTLVSYPLSGTGIFTGLAYDPDGYTTELEPVTQLGATLPYFLVVDDSMGTEATYNKFEQGDTVDFGIGFDLTSGGLQFDLWLTMAYGASAKKLQRLTPKYYNPEFNRNAAWKVNVIPTHGMDVPTQENTWNDLDAVTPFDVTVEVYDWQAGAVVTADPLLFADAAATEVFASSEVASVSAEVPGMTAALATEMVADSGTGAFDDPFVYTVAVANENLLPIGEYTGLVKVLDARAPAADWATEGRDFLIDSPDGIALNNYNLPEYATYQTFPAIVVTGCGPITGTVDAPMCPVTGVANGGFVNFAVSATSDNGGGAITLYEVDFDYDGTTFTADDSNTDGIFANVGPFMVADPCLSNIPQDFTVAFRATDSCDTPNVTVFATCLATVDTCLETVGNVTLEVNRMNSPYSSTLKIFDTATPWTLSWDAAGGAVEYAIYYDIDDSDGLTNDLMFVDATTLTTFDVPASHLPSTHYVPGNTYVVRSRSTVGDAGSESADSQAAWISANGFETCGGTYVSPAPEGWDPFWASTSTSWIARPSVLNQSGFQAGNNCAGIGPFMGPNYTNYGGMAAGMTKETPAVADSSVREISMICRFQQVYAPTGIFFGTCDDPQPSTNFTAYSDIEWASAYSSGIYTGYTQASTDVTNNAGDPPASGNNSWRYISSADYYRTLGADVNVDGTAADKYVAIAHYQFTSNSQPYPRWDEVAVVVY